MVQATTEDNRRLYERHGFVCVKTLAIAQGVQWFLMVRQPFRPDNAQATHSVVVTRVLPKAARIRRRTEAIQTYTVDTGHSHVRLLVA